jgi:DNA-binding transcriptional LysR family regulator
MYNRLHSLDLNALVLFHELARAESLRQAARQLQIPAATVSRKLRELEQGMGAVLFKRGSRQLTLTPAGAALQEHCERLVAGIEAAQGAVTEMQADARGQIRVSLPVGFGTNLISVAIAKFALANPQVEFLTQAALRPVDLVTDPIDVAFNVGPVRNESLPAMKLSELHRGVYGSRTFCEKHGVPLKPADLLKFDCISLDSQRAAGLWTFRVGARRVVARTRTSVDDISTAFHMMRTGLGFAVIPNFLCQEGLRTGELQRVLPQWKIPPLAVTATYLERRHVPRRIRAFLDFVREELRPLRNLP